MFVSQLQDHRVGSDFMTTDRVLGNHLILVFDFHGYVLIGQIASRFFENRSHFSGFNAVFIILPHPNLQLARQQFAQLSAAIEK